MQAHHGKVIVVKYGGAAMERASLAASFAAGHRACCRAPASCRWSCTAAGPQVTKMSASLGIETTFVDGVRVTDAETLDVATMVLAGKLNTEVVASLVTGGVPAVGLSGVDGGMLLARKQTAPDLGFVGEVVHVNADVVRTLIGATVRARGGVDRGGRVRAGVQRERRRRGGGARDRARRREARVPERRAGSDRTDGRTALGALRRAMSRPAWSRGRGGGRHDPEARERRATRSKPAWAACTWWTAGSSTRSSWSCSRPRASAP